MTVVRSILGMIELTAPHGTPVGEFLEAAMPGDLVNVVTNPKRPGASVKMTKQQADTYLKDHPEAVIMGGAPAEAPDKAEPDAKAVEKADVEDKAVTKAENKGRGK